MHKILTGLTGMAALLAAGVAITGVVQAQDDERIERGKEIATNACSPCHAIGKSGASPNPKSPVFRHLRERYTLDNLEEALAEGILVGHPEMPQVKMNANDISAFLRYLDSVQTTKP